MFRPAKPGAKSQVKSFFSCVSKLGSRNKKLPGDFGFLNSFLYDHSSGICELGVVGPFRYYDISESTGTNENVLYIPDNIPTSENVVFEYKHIKD